MNLIRLSPFFTVPDSLRCGGRPTGLAIIPVDDSANGTDVEQLPLLKLYGEDLEKLLSPLVYAKMYSAIRAAGTPVQDGRRSLASGSVEVVEPFREGGALNDGGESNPTVEAASFFGYVLIQNHQSWSLDRGHEDAAFSLGCQFFSRGEYQPGAAG